jgi:DNA-directed RNA polymerase subunit RPC12/RpoP
VVTLNCIHCGSKHARTLTSEEGYAEFACNTCGKRWGMIFKMVEVEDKEKDEVSIAPKKQTMQ